MTGQCIRPLILNGLNSQRLIWNLELEESFNVLNKIYNKGTWKLHDINRMLENFAKHVCNILYMHTLTVDDQIKPTYKVI